MPHDTNDFLDDEPVSPLQPIPEDDDRPLDVSGIRRSDVQRWLSTLAGKNGSKETRRYVGAAIALLNDDRAEPDEAPAPLPEVVALRELQANFETAVDARVREIASAAPDYLNELPDKARQAIAAAVHREVEKVRAETRSNLRDRIRGLAARGRSMQEILKLCFGEAK